MFVTLRATDGHDLDCWSAVPCSGVWGAVVLVHGIFGITPHLREVASIYADDGLRVLVPSLFDRLRRRAVVPADRPSAGQGMADALSPQAALMDIGAAVAALRAEGQGVAVVGYCWGGGLALRAAQDMPVACAVSYCATRPDDVPQLPLKVPALGHFGTADGHVSPTVLARLQVAQPTLDIRTYAAGHGFSESGRPTYDPSAALLADARTLGFLRAHL